jgi:hypothetical protein
MTMSAWSHTAGLCALHSWASGGHVRGRRSSGGHRVAEVVIAGDQLTRRLHRGHQAAPPVEPPQSVAQHAAELAKHPQQHLLAR